MSEQMTLEEQIRSDYKAFTDSRGMIENAQNPSVNQSGNGQLYSAEYFALLDYLKYLDDQDRIQFLTIMDSCDTGIKGLYYRNFINKDAQSIDNYIGIVASSCFLATRHRYDVLSFGQENGWHFNPNEQARHTAQNWFGRFRAFEPFVMMACYMKPNWWERFEWAITIATSGLFSPKSQDEWFLSWLLIMVYKKQDRECCMCNSAVSYWRKRFKKQWFSLSSLAEVYFNGRNHPHAKYLGLVQI